MERRSPSVTDNGHVNEPIPVLQEVDLGTARLLPDVDRPRAWLLTVDHAPQSYVDLDDPTHLEFEYVRRLAHVLDCVRPGALDLLHLGGGGMTLPRYVGATRPGSRQQVVEVDWALVELVAARLPLPSSVGDEVGVCVRDALEAVEDTLAESVDVLVADVFSGARVPGQLTTVAYAESVARVLRPEGVYAANLADGAPFAFLRGQLATFAEVFEYLCVVAEPGVLRGRRFGNAILVASRTPLPLAELTRRAASDPFPARVVHGAALRKLIGSVSPVRTAAGSPEPPSGAFSVG